MCYSIVSVYQKKQQKQYISQKRKKDSIRIISYLSIGYCFDKLCVLFSCAFGISRILRFIFNLRDKKLLTTIPPCSQNVQRMRIKTLHHIENARNDVICYQALVRVQSILIQSSIKLYYLPRTTGGKCRRKCAWQENIV